LLFRADLSGAKLCRAELNQDPYKFPFSTDLTEANLQGADLSYADLSNAILVNANLKNADLTGTNLKGAKLQGTIMPNGSTYNLSI
jgi:uncharacterized protein YjbI with pentapeptide repeats